MITYFQYSHNYADAARYTQLHHNTHSWEGGFRPRGFYPTLTKKWL